MNKLVLLLILSSNILFANSFKMIETKYLKYPTENGKIKYTTYAIHIICIDGYKWMISGKYETASQMFEKFKSTKPPQAIRCK